MLKKKNKNDLRVLYRKTLNEWTNFKFIKTFFKCTLFYLIVRVDQKHVTYGNVRRT